MQADAHLGVLVFLARIGHLGADALMTATVRRWNADGVVLRVSTPGHAFVDDGLEAGLMPLFTLVRARLADP